MTTLSAFIKNPRNTFYDGADEDEQVLYVLRRSHLTNVGWFLTFLLMLVAPFFINTAFVKLEIDINQLLGATFDLVLLIFWYVACFGIALFRSVNWFFNVYLITNKKIIDFDFHGLTYKNISDTPIANVQDVTAKISGPFRMIFNVGDVFIQTAAENREFDFSHVDDPGRVRDIISDLVANLKHHHV